MVLRRIGKNAVFTALCLVLIMVLCTAVQAYSLDGSGTEEDPYLITNSTDFRIFIESIPGGFESNVEGIHYAITSDITFNGELHPTAFFGGELDGRGHTVSGLQIVPKDGIEYSWEIGLFSRITDTGYVHDLTLEGSVAGGNCVGGFAGCSSGVIENCHSKLSVTGAANVGGIVGRQDSGKVVSCTNQGTVISKRGNAGGIAGTNSGSTFISRCANFGAVSGRREVGGIVGNGGAEYSYNLGSVEGTSTVGGIVGMNLGTMCCYNTGSVTGDNKVGGITGNSCWDLIACYNTGDVAGRNNTGGVIGIATDSIRITTCFFLDDTAEDNGWGISIRRSELSSLHKRLGKRYIYNTRIGRPVLVDNTEVTDAAVPQIVYIVGGAVLLLCVMVALTVYMQKKGKAVTASEKAEDRIPQAMAEPAAAEAPHPVKTRKWVVITAVLCLILLVGSIVVWRNLVSRPFTLVYENGKAYLKFREKQEGQGTSTQITDPVIAEIVSPTFTDVDSMRKAILSGKLPEDYLAYLQQNAVNGVFEICDPDKLYEAVLPEGLHYENVVLSGANYYFNLSEISTATSHLFCMPEDQFLLVYSKQFVNGIDSNACILSDSEIADRNARQVIFTYNGRTFKNLYYFLETPRRKTAVLEQYRLQDMNDQSTVTPFHVTLFGAGDGGYFIAELPLLKDRPSVEWLSQFGLKALYNNADNQDSFIFPALPAHLGKDPIIYDPNGIPFQIMAYGHEQYYEAYEMLQDMVIKDLEDTYGHPGAENLDLYRSGKKGFPVPTEPCSNGGNLWLFPKDESVPVFIEPSEFLGKCWFIFKDPNGIYCTATIKIADLYGEQNEDSATMNCTQFLSKYYPDALAVLQSKENCTKIQEQELIVDGSSLSVLVRHTNDGRFQCYYLLDGRMVVIAADTMEQAATTVEHLRITEL